MDTVFGVASVTKSFTRVAILVLQEQGKLSVHDPVETYLPEFFTPTDHTPSYFPNNGITNMPLQAGFS